ncbi:MAG: acylglycerol lipase [Myxococcota bacterium]|jgi:acylglycerol lipase
MMHEGWLSGHRGTPIFYRWAMPDCPARAILLLLHGYSEHSARHHAFLRHMLDAGFAVFAPDHRGHGRTGPVPGLITDMDEVIADVGHLHRRALERVAGQPVFLLGHSMGGLIALRYTQLHGERLRGLIVNGPGIEVPKSIPRPVIAASKVVSRWAPGLWVQRFYEPGRGHSDAEQQQQDADDPLIYKGWIRAGTGTTVHATIKRTVAELDRIRLPVLATVGSEDRTVSVTTSDTVIRGVGSTDTTHHVFTGLSHEVYLEPRRAEVFAVWRAWMEERL